LKREYPQGEGVRKTPKANIRTPPSAKICFCRHLLFKRRNYFNDYAILYLKSTTHPSMDKKLF